MTDKFQEKKSSDHTKSNQPLTGMQKFLFGMVCWGVQTWSKVNRFKAEGYDRKYKQAKQAIRSGLIIYGMGITLFILILMFKS